MKSDTRQELEGIQELTRSQIRQGGYATVQLLLGQIDRLTTVCMAQQLMLETLEEMLPAEPLLRPNGPFALAINGPQS